ncbi:hydrolase [Streptomyces sp. NPDC005706]|uniref:hydrolase n=1 Tax=Streptomyces sp. NPDC005706 TaxID=3157169 RepID=UPI0033E6E0D8
MHSPHPPHPQFPSRPGSPSGESESDHTLAARLGGPPAGRHDAVALLLARHWRATFDYAVVCLAAAGPSARLVASAAFQQVLGRPATAAAGGALRPRLLAAVRDTVRAWAADEAACVVLPELRKPAGGRGLRATAPRTPERRRVAERAFHALPVASQCLLWHTEVEAESINIPAGLLGMDTATAATGLRSARAEFRAGCLRAHRELAPSAECRFYNRLLDGSLHEGGAPLPDARRHLTACSHCRHAAEQLSAFEGGPGALIAESVLGWGARRYLDSRPGRAAREEPRAPARRPAATIGRPGAAARSGRRTTLAVGVGLASLGLLASVLVAMGRPDDNGVPHPAATLGAPAGRPESPAAAGTRPRVTPWAAAPVRIAHGNLRDRPTGSCPRTRGTTGVQSGAGVRDLPRTAVLATCRCRAHSASARISADSVRAPGSSGSQSFSTR